MNHDISNYNWPGVLEFLYVFDLLFRQSTRKWVSRKTCGSSKRKNLQIRLKNLRGSWQLQRLSAQISGIKITCLNTVSGKWNPKIKMKRMLLRKNRKYPCRNADPPPTSRISQSNHPITQNSLFFGSSQPPRKHQSGSQGQNLTWEF